MGPFARSSPNEYLYYYDFTRDAVAAIRAGGLTRGEFLARQQQEFYAAAAANPAQAQAIWTASRAEREATYMAAEHAGQARGGEQDVADVGGYEGVALALMRAIAADEQATMILDVANRGTVPGLPDDAVVEVPVTVGSDGVPLASPPDAPPARPHGPGEGGRAVVIEARHRLSRRRRAGVRRAPARRLGDRGPRAAARIPRPHSEVDEVFRR